jgi:hypothetical protein
VGQNDGFQALKFAGCPMPCGVVHAMAAFLAGTNND